MASLSWVIRLAIAVIVVIAIAEFAPEAVNVVLLLLIVGMLLAQSETVASIVAAVIGQ